MHSCFFYINDSISPSIYSPSEILSTNPKIRILPDCQPTQFFYSILLVENKEKDTINKKKPCKKRSSLQSGDQISVYHKSELIGHGIFYSQGAHFFIWHDTEGNERFQVKDGLLTIKKIYDSNTN